MRAKHFCFESEIAIKHGRAALGGRAQRNKSFTSYILAIKGESAVYGSALGGVIRSLASVDRADLAAAGRS